MSVRELTGPIGDTWRRAVRGARLMRTTRRAARARVPGDLSRDRSDTARVLAPGGVLALDTPNAAVCRLQQAELCYLLAYVARRR